MVKEEIDSKKKGNIENKKDNYGSRLKKDIKNKSLKIKKKVCEIFKIKKKGKEKTIEMCGMQEEQKVTKGQIEHHNKLLRNILIFVGLILVVFLISYFALQSIRQTNYNGIVEFETQSYCATKPCLIVYQTSLPVIMNEKPADYNFYFRTHPFELERIDFDGDLNILPNMVLEYPDNAFSCEGYGNIAIANLMNLYKVLGTTVIQDRNASCDSEGRYMYVELKEGDKTRIEKVGPSCYDIYIKDCEILEATEKFMAETFVYAHEKFL